MSIPKGENRPESFNKEGDYIPITHNNLYPQVYDFGNIYDAWNKSKKGKRYKPEILRFSQDLEGNLIQIQNELIWKTYKPGAYHEFYIYEPKKRLVSAPPFRDRVVHHALCNVIEPLFEKKMIYDSYACRNLKGSHRAADRTQKYLREAVARWGEVYCLKCDIKQYFPSIPHGVLKRIYRRTIYCRDTLWLLDTIIDNGADLNDVISRRLPIGALTSQLNANSYMDQVDHLVKEKLREPYYIRYMDDFIILSPSKEHLWEVKRQIECYLNCELLLEFNKKTTIFPINQGVDFVGYRIWPTHRLLRKRSVKKFKRKLRVLERKYASREITYREIDCCVQSWIGHAKHADSYRLRVKIFGEFKLKRQGGLLYELS